jgi:hypothetical protein
MAGLRFTDVQSRPTEFLDFTSLTLDEFQHLVPPFEAAFQARMATWRMDGRPRTARRFTVDQNCPLPTPEDRLLCILVSLKTYALQVVQGRLFGGSALHVMLFLENLLRALLIFNGLRSRYCQRAFLVYHSPFFWVGTGMPGIFTLTAPKCVRLVK